MNNKYINKLKNLHYFKINVRLLFSLEPLKFKTHRINRSKTNTFIALLEIENNVIYQKTYDN